MKHLALIALSASAAALSGCATTDATTLPFDLASTTGDTATSTFGTTSGGGSEQASLQQERYVATQIDWIRRDAARGHGESLQALAELLGEPDPAAFANWTQVHYEVLFADLEQPEELLLRIRQYR